MWELSDFEEVKLTASQWQRLDLLNESRNNAIWRIADILQAKLDSSQVITAINNLSRKVDLFMASQEERLRGVKAKLDAIQTGVDKIQQQLADLKTNNPELDDEIAAIEATAAAIDTDVNPVVESPTEPTP